LLLINIKGWPPVIASLFSRNQFITWSAFSLSNA
jgi:hypothetical protein